MLLEFDAPRRRPNPTVSVVTTPRSSGSLPVAPGSRSLTGRYTALGERSWKASPFSHVTGLVAVDPKPARLLALATDGLIHATGETGHELLTNASAWAINHAQTISTFTAAATAELTTPTAESRDFLDGLARTVTPRMPHETPQRNWLLAYESDDVIALAAVEFALLLAAEAAFGICEHCGCLFVMAARSDELYCTRPAPGPDAFTRTCRQVGPQVKYHEHIDDRAAIYRASFKRLDKLVRRKNLDRALLDQWRERAVDMRTVAATGDDLRNALDDLAAELGLA